MNSNEYHGDLHKEHYPKPTVFIILFVILSLLDIAGVITDSLVLKISAKPLIIPVLIIYLYYNFSKVNHLWLIYAALLFSTMGDVFLLFEFMQPAFFLFGVGAFLVAHIFYIIYFLKIRSWHRSFFRKQPWWLLLIYSYSFGLVMLIYPGLKEMEVPVIIYAMVITFMIISSLHVFHKVQSPANKYYLIGAGLFVLSDSMLAIDKFYYKFPLAGTAIMLTYCAAQFLIVQGVVHHKEATQPKSWWEN